MRYSQNGAQNFTPNARRRMSRIVSTKLAAVHSPTSAPSHSKAAGAHREHLLNRLLQRRGDVGRQPPEDIGDRQLRVLALAQQMRDRRREDEERKQREDRKIGEVAGVDEAVVIDSDGDPLDHFPRSDLRLELLLDLGAEGARACSPGACASLRAIGGDVAHEQAGLNPEIRARVARRVPFLGELLQLGVVRRNVDLDAHQLVAALAVLGGEAAALEAQHLARRRPLGNGQHHRPFGRRHLHLGAEHRFLQRDREIQANVVAFAREEAVRSDLDRDDRVAASGRPFLTLAGEPDLGPVLEPLRQLEVDRLAVGRA